MWRIWSGGPLKRSAQQPPLPGVSIPLGSSRDQANQRQPGQCCGAAGGLGGLHIRCGPLLPLLGTAMACCQSPFVTIYNRMGNPAPLDNSSYVSYGSQGNRC